MAQPPQIIKTVPFDDQKPGTSGLRKTTQHFQQTHYLENFIQSIFNYLSVQANGDLSTVSIVIGGDGRYFNREATRRIVAMAAANGIGRVMIGQGGLLSTPAASCLIRKYGATGGIILSASHNPGGPSGDFGVKFNAANGGPASERITSAIYEETRQIDRYYWLDVEPDIDTLGECQIAQTAVQVIDSVKDYVELMQSLFDIDAIRAMLNASACRFTFDGMSAITGVYAKALFGELLGVDDEALMNCEPLEDFGGGHPDPNLVHAKELVNKMFDANGPDLGAASDGDGDRNMILGRQCYVTPSDSLAIIVANARMIPAYTEGLSGVARSMPTSSAVDAVAADKGIPCYETPTGWKFFGSLLDANRITLCGEESFGTGSNHVREKDGLWAVMCWLNILAERKESVADIVAAHWRRYGRHFYTRHDYEGISLQSGEDILKTLEDKITDFNVLKALLLEQGMRLSVADNFTYQDPVDDSVTSGQGIRLLFEDGSRIVYRLSGTGTVGATLRVYIERLVVDPAMHQQDAQEVLEDLIRVSREVAEVKPLTGRDQPSVIT